MRTRRYDDPDYLDLELSHRMKNQKAKRSPSISISLNGYIPFGFLTIVLGRKATLRTDPVILNPQSSDLQTKDLCTAGI